MPDANATFMSDPSKVPEELKLPFIRLRVEYSGPFQVVSMRNFNPHFNGRLANNQDYIQFFKNKCFAAKDRKPRQKGLIKS